MSFDEQSYKDRIKVLTARAKEGNGYTMDCDIGETAYLEVLLLYIKQGTGRIVLFSRNVGKK